MSVAGAGETSTAEKTDTGKSVESTPQLTSGIEDLFKDSSSVTPSSALEKPQKDVKNDIMSLFEKVSAMLFKIVTTFYDLIWLVLFIEFCYFL